MALKLVHSAPPPARWPFIIALALFGVLGGPVIIPRLFDPVWEAEDRDGTIVEVHERTPALTVRHKNMSVGYTMIWNQHGKVVATHFGLTRIGHIGSPPREATASERELWKKYHGHERC